MARAAYFFFWQVQWILDEYGKTKSCDRVLSRLVQGNYCGYDMEAVVTESRELIVRARGRKRTMVG